MRRAMNPRNVTPIPMAELPPQDDDKGKLINTAEFVDFNSKKLSNEQKRFLVGLLMWGTQTRACMETRTSPFSVEEWKDDSKDFKLAYEIILGAVGDVLEEKAIRLAMQGNDKLLMKLLQGYKPHKYGKKLEVGGPGGGPIPVSIADLARRYASDQGEDGNGESQKEGS